MHAYGSFLSPEQVNGGVARILLYENYMGHALYHDSFSGPRESQRGPRSMVINQQDVEQMEQQSPDC